MQNYRVKDSEGRVILQRVVVAHGFWQRARGLLGRSGLEHSEGLLIETNSIHTCFMRFPLDLLYLNREGRVLKIVRGLSPWRISGCAGACQVIECAAGALPSTLIEGELLSLEY